MKKIILLIIFLGFGIFYFGFGQSSKDQKVKRQTIETNIETTTYDFDIWGNIVSEKGESEHPIRKKHVPNYKYKYILDSLGKPLEKKTYVNGDTLEVEEYMTYDSIGNLKLSNKTIHRPWKSASFKEVYYYDSENRVVLIEEFHLDKDSFKVQTNYQYSVRNDTLKEIRSRFYPNSKSNRKEIKYYYKDKLVQHQTFSFDQIQNEVVSFFDSEMNFILSISQKCIGEDFYSITKRFDHTQESKSYNNKGELIGHSISKFYPNGKLKERRFLLDRGGGCLSMEGMYTRYHYEYW